MDFTTQGAREYYENKFSKIQNESFEGSIKKTNELLPIVQENLNKIDKLLPNTTNFYGDIFSMADMHLFPALRNLTVVKDLVFPERLKKYLEYQADLANLKLFFDQAI